jgi:hypothetical protein
MYFYLLKTETIFDTAPIQIEGVFRDISVVISVIVSTDYPSKPTVINDEEEKFVDVVPGKPGFSGNDENKRRMF